MSLDISLEIEVTEYKDVFSSNITHNLTDMAKEAGIYMHVWRPDEIGLCFAEDIVEPLESAIKEMKKEPERFRKHDAPNGWGTYSQFLPWLVELLEACKENPKAKISTSR